MRLPIFQVLEGRGAELVLGWRQWRRGGQAGGQGLCGRQGDGSGVGKRSLKGEGQTVARELEIKAGRLVGTYSDSATASTTTTNWST